MAPSPPKIHLFRSRNVSKLYRACVRRFVVFWGVLFLAFAVMVWVLSGMVGGGWFWGAKGRGCGAERLGLKGWGFGRLCFFFLL